jgi:hypothetical protein
VAGLGGLRARGLLALQGVADERNRRPPVTALQCGVMAPELSSLIDPGHTALVTQECQDGVIGTRSPRPPGRPASR